MKALARKPLHPLIFSLYPVLALLANNILQIKPQAVLRPLLVVIAGALLLWLVLRLLLGSWERSALVCTWLLVLFFTYGHVYHAAQNASGLGGFFGHQRTLLPLWTALAIVGYFWLKSRPRDLAEITPGLNLVSVVLLVLPLLQLGSFAISSRARSTTLPEGFDSLRLPAGQAAPDVYYIILDAYARQDTYQETMGGDNSAFLQGLADLGFTVAGCSQSNYAQTQLSLSSSLNLSYLTDLGVELDPDREEMTALLPFLRHSTVRRVLQGLGYTFISFETGFGFSEFSDADLYLAPERGAFSEITDFEWMLARSTLGLALIDSANLPVNRFRISEDAPKKIHYDRVLFVLDALQRIPGEVPGPKFVFVHLIAPHSPLVFGPAGEMVLHTDQSKIGEDEYFAAYQDELAYLNGRMLQIVTAILQQSAVPPVIIIQGDHGHERSTHEDRMKILNAYYLAGDNSAVYASISPVNSFRLVFNQVLGGSLPLLEDASFYSEYHSPYQFESIPNDCTP